MKCLSDIGKELTLSLLMLCIAFSAKAFPLKVNGIDTTRTAILIRDLRFGYNLVAENIDRSLIPASVMKSVTVASMLNLADTSECFTTPVMAVGAVKNGVLDGNIVVKVCGDPTIESRFLPTSQGFADSIAAGLHRMGVKEIKGRVIIDESDFADATTPPGWMDEDLLWPYGARLQGANFRDNRFRLRFPSKDTDPFVPGLKYNYVNRRRRGLKLDRKDGSETLIVSGNPNRRFSDELAMPYPWKAMSYEIESTLRDSGIAVDNEAVRESDVTATVYEHRSPSFGEIMRSLMYRSDNLMAEGILRAITPGGTRSDAIAEEMAVWSMAGVSAHGVVIKDGSGLSRDNRLTARFLADIYQYMLTDPFGSDYTALFPKAGYDGTMRNFLLYTALEGRVAMKTGSMKGVQSYAGYLFNEEGRPTHVIIFMANNFRCSRAALKSDIERLLLEKFDVSLQSETTSDEETRTEEEQENDEQRYDEPVESGLRDRGTADASHQPR